MKIKGKILAASLALRSGGNDSEQSPHASGNSSL